jgi:hypothetical protein
MSLKENGKMKNNTYSTGGEISISNSGSSNKTPPVENTLILKWEAYKKVK